MRTCPTSADAEPRFGERSRLQGLPPDLWVVERAPAQGWAQGAPIVVLVHGSLDRAASFSRVVRRLPELGVVTYDRRGYQGSRGAPVTAGLAPHIADLVHIAEAYAARRLDGSEARPGAHGAGERARAPWRVVAIGHSVGATIVLGAAVARPDLFAAVGAYEPSMPWLGFHRRPARADDSTAGGAPSTPERPDPAKDAAEEAERFFRRMVSDAAWERLSDAERASRQADGPALVADLRAIRGAPPFDVTGLSVPTIVSCGGPASASHHRQTADWLETHVTVIHKSVVPDAGHGAHLSHPDAFADLVRDVVAQLPEGRDHGHALAPPRAPHPGMHARNAPHSGGRTTVSAERTEDKEPRGHSGPPTGPDALLSRCRKGPF